MRHVRELLTTYQENEEGSVLSVATSRNSSSNNTEESNRTSMKRRTNATQLLVITNTNLTKRTNASVSSSHSKEYGSSEPELDYSELAVLTGNTASGVTKFVWEPYISLHAVKHIFNVTLPADFTKDKLNTLIESSAEVKRKGVYSADICVPYFNEALLQKTVLPNFYGKCHEGFASDDVTLLIQMDTSSGYFEKLYQVVQYWSGPISVALFVNGSDSEGYVTEDQLRARVQKLFSEHEIEGASLCLHLVTSQVSGFGCYCNSCKM